MAACGEGYIEDLGNLHIESSDATDIAGPEATMFDQVIGHIEDIIMDIEFQQIQNDFMEKYWVEFEDSEENKLVYMDIFTEYTDVIEKYIENKLQALVPDFEMADFIQQIKQHKADLEGEIFEILLTFTDFLVFKEMFLDYKAVKEGKVEDLSTNIVVTSMHGLI